MSSEDEFGAVSYLTPQSFESHRVLARQFSVNDSGIVDFHGSRNSSRIGLAIPNNCYDDWDENSDPRTPTSTHALFFQRTNSHPPLVHPWANQLPVLGQVPDKFMKVPDYEELPNSTRPPDDLGVYTPIDEGLVTVPSLKKSQKEMNLNGKPAPLNISTNRYSSRLRTNPLYDQSGGSFKLAPYPPPRKGLHSGVSCCLQTFSFLFALMALAVALMSFLIKGTGETYDQSLATKIEDLQSNLSNIYQMMQNSEWSDASISLSRIKDLNPIARLLLNNTEMLDTLSALENKVMSIRMQVSLQEASIQNLTNRIATQTDQITILKSQESLANETFENLKLSIGEKKQLEMRGLANMSACSHRRKSMGVSSETETTTVDLIKQSRVLVLGVLCTTTGGTVALLDDANSQSGNYTCVCRGRVDGQNFRHCIIRYWSCPLLF